MSGFVSRVRYLMYTNQNKDLFAEPQHAHELLPYETSPMIDVPHRRFAASTAFLIPCHPSRNPMVRLNRNLVGPKTDVVICITLSFTCVGPDTQLHYFCLPPPQKKPLCLEGKNKCIQDSHSPVAFVFLLFPFMDHDFFCQVFQWHTCTTFEIGINEVRHQTSVLRGGWVVLVDDGFLVGWLVGWLVGVE